MKILLIRTGGLGDTILTLGAAQWLKDKRHDTAVMAHGRYGAAAAAFGFDFIAEEESGFESLYSEPSAALAGALNGFDLVIAVKADISGGLETRLQKVSGGRAIRINPLPPPDFEKAYSLYLSESIAGYLGIQAPVDAPYPKTLAGWKKPRKFTLSIHPGSGSPKKNWEFGNYLKLARIQAGRRAAGVNFIFGPVEMERMTEEIKQAASAGINVISNPGYAELAEILAGSSVFAGCDSGVTHLAAAMGVPTVALFGPSNVNVWRPVGARVKIVRADGGRMSGVGVDQAAEAVAAADYFEMDPM